MTNSVQLISSSPQRTQEIGQFLGEHARPGDVFLLTGLLGAGKTCLTQGIAWGIGVEGYVRSPTFVIITRYTGRLLVHHIDLYRIADMQEALDLGLEEYLYGEEVCVIEWAEKAPGLFPESALEITLEYGAGEAERLITIDSKAETSKPFLDRLSEAVAGLDGRQ